MSLNLKNFLLLGVFSQSAGYLFALGFMLECACSHQESLEDL